MLFVIEINVINSRFPLSQESYFEIISTSFFVINYKTCKNPCGYKFLAVSWFLWIYYLGNCDWSFSKELIWGHINKNVLKTKMRNISVNVFIISASKSCFRKNNERYTLLRESWNILVENFYAKPSHVIFLYVLKKMI